MQKERLYHFFQTLSSHHIQDPTMSPRIYSNVVHLEIILHSIPRSVKPPFSCLQIFLTWPRVYYQPDHPTKWTQRNMEDSSEQSSTVLCCLPPKPWPLAVNKFLGPLFKKKINLLHIGANLGLTLLQFLPLLGKTTHTVLRCSKHSSTKNLCS